MKDGTVKEFKPSAGNCTSHIQYEGVFAIIQDTYGNRTSIPAQDIAEIYQEAKIRGY
jgi:hypothetical protein